ncbi:LEA type 2 family protein [Dyadobacter sp. NIV53]|uniref:NDR1/HIN1-like protein n=1 Tax=Dyadobacter sp. NIV53 TaxID=2861765 RepID=UPI001C8853BA|nr:LEA type 2 family protein [Dyadobacter sp. NIV53]
MGTNKWLILIIILLISGLGFWWWKSPSSIHAKEETAEKLMPGIGFASLQITDVDDKRIKLQSKVVINNPLPIKINTKRLDYTIYIDSVKVIEDAYEKPVSIHSSDSSTIELPMELLAKPMARILKYFDDNKIDSAIYSMKTTFEVDVPIANERIVTLNVSKKLPAMRIPEFKIKDADLNALSLKSKGMYLQVEVINPNLFPLKISNGAFLFNIQDAMEMKGALQNVVNVPAKGSRNVTMHAEITDGNILKTGWKLLTDKKGTHFNCKFSGKVESDNKMLNNSNMVMNVKGTLDEILNAVKNK